MSVDTAFGAASIGGMKDETENPLEAKVESQATAGALATAGGTAVLQGAAGDMPGAILGLFTTVLTMTFGFAYDLRKRMVAEWWNWMQTDAGDGGPTGAEFEELLRADAHEPYVSETVFRSIRAASDSVDPAAMKPLARLARWYSLEKRSPDRFFRDVASMLADMSKEEINELRKLLLWLRGSAPRKTYRLRHEGNKLVIMQEDKLEKIVWESGAEDLLAILRNHDIGTAIYPYLSAVHLLPETTVLDLIRVLGSRPYVGFVSGAAMVESTR